MVTSYTLFYITNDIDTYIFAVFTLYTIFYDIFHKYSDYLRISGKYTDIISFAVYLITYEILHRII